MSASPIARQAHSHAQLIPSMRKILISEPSQMPDVYSSTPNGTLYSTTPGGNYRTWCIKWQKLKALWVSAWKTSRSSVREKPVFEQLCCDPGPLEAVKPTKQLISTLKLAFLISLALIRLVGACQAGLRDDNERNFYFRFFFSFFLIKAHKFPLSECEVAKPWWIYQRNEQKKIFLSKNWLVNQPTRKWGGWNVGQISREAMALERDGNIVR